MKFQIRIKDRMGDKPASELFDDIHKANEAYEAVRQEVRDTWAEPDVDAVYMIVYWSHGGSARIK